MPGYTVRRLDEITNIFEGIYPGEMRMITYQIDAEQVALTYRRMPQHTGGKGSYGHRHKTQEEICLLYTSPSPRDGLLSRMPSSA